MVDLNSRTEESLNHALELLHFGFRAITSHPDERLAELGYSRVHHRILYFIGRHPGSSINGLLQIMKVSKQYLHRPLKRLVDDGYVVSQADPRDRRSKRLGLTAKGACLEASLTGEQREQLAEAFRRVGPGAEAGWRRVMALLAGEE
jgi:DNA-binding MarR family transcriptional regulator